MGPQDLIEWRRRNGYSQGSLAKALNVDVMTVSRWERGIRKEIPSFLHLALDALECQRKGVKKRKGPHRKDVTAGVISTLNGGIKCPLFL